MDCPFCYSNQSSVIDKRAVKGTGEIRRRRECLKCKKRYTTYERICILQIYVVKRDGRKELFNIEKIRKGLERALEKRPGITRLGDITKKVESKIRSRSDKEIESKAIGQIALSELKKLDKVAYLRFASVYRQFNELGDFRKELEHLRI